MKRDLAFKKLRDWISILLPSLFLGFLWLPTIDSFFAIDHAPIPTEKRQLTSFPAYRGMAELKVFLAGLEGYFNDHFGFRKRLVRTNNHWKRQLFHEGGNSVIEGLNGWKFYTGEKMIENYTGLARFSQQDLSDWQMLLERRRDWLAKRGCKYLFVIPPDKHSVYPEFLPPWLVKTDKPSKLDQLLAHMKEHSTVEVLDLRKSLIEAKKSNVVFLMTDTHWNLYGGFAAYQELVRTMGQHFPGISPLPIDNFQRTPIDGPRGDLVDLSGDDKAKETQYVKFTPIPPLQPLDMKLDKSRLEYAWTRETTPTITTNSLATRKAIVFHDSFCCYWYAILGHHFNEVVYIWRYYWDGPFLEREKPDVVIDEMVERFVCNQNPKELMTKDGLN